ncbi:MAG: hypothetical protein BLITH_1586 [Brockia lithotrophica]|uniref:Uncharacterized protein n=1 Tax=Brockia lithotrophica TaxID=933949 RepID=A0A2T5G5P4_9BACL|nr:MAG: hypothetical protein BLITH_1586 [Brockia lithotrophica]
MGHGVSLLAGVSMHERIRLLSIPLVLPHVKNKGSRGIIAERRSTVNARTTSRIFRSLPRFVSYGV